MTICVVGGGIVGLVSAQLAKRRAPDRDVILLEATDRAGGLLCSDNHPEVEMRFDRGTHLVSQTGIAEIDDILFESINDENWHVLRGTNRDRSGHFLEKEIVEASPFLAANVEMAEPGEFIANPLSTTSHSDLEAELSTRFGSKIFCQALKLPIENLYQTPCNALDTTVARQLPLGRIRLHEFEEWQSRSSDENYRALVACPDQMRLPIEFQSTSLAAYPKTMGIERHIDDLAACFESTGGRILLSSTISELNVTENKITQLTVTKTDGSNEADAISGDLEVLWASPPFGGLKLLGLALPVGKFVPGWKTMLLDFFAEPNAALEGYYYLDYGRNSFFRLTNYAAFCQQAREQSQHPFTLEIWHRGDNLSLKDAQSLVSKRLIELGILKSSQSITHPNLRQLIPGFPLASVDNIKFVADTAQILSSSKPDNFHNIGLLNKPGQFLTPNLLQNAYSAIGASGIG